MLNGMNEAYEVAQTARTAGLPKIGKLAVKPINQRGRPMSLHKAVLGVDHTYQRDIDSQSKIKKMAAEWDWTACGAIKVAQRPDGTYFVFDGQHRVAAAMLRPEITTLDCMVYRMEGAEDEAKAFLKSNTTSTAVRAAAKHRALLAAGDPVAIHVERLVAQSGRRLTTTGSGPTTIACVAALRRCIEVDRDGVTRIWPIVCDLARGHTLNDIIVQGLCYIERNMEGSLTETRWRGRILKIGYDELLSGAKSAASFYKRGGDKQWALGMLETINKGLQKRLEIRA